MLPFFADCRLRYFFLTIEEFFCTLWTMGGRIVFFLRTDSPPTLVWPVVRSAGGSVDPATQFFSFPEPGGDMYSAWKPEKHGVLFIQTTGHSTLSLVFSFFFLYLDVCLILYIDGCCAQHFFFFFSLGMEIKIDMIILKK